MTHDGKETLRKLWGDVFEFYAQPDFKRIRDVILCTFRCLEDHQAKGLGVQLSSNYSWFDIQKALATMLTKRPAADGIKPRF
jgi:hypothetical protein